jgi:hypothetical protein
MLFWHAIPGGEAFRSAAARATETCPIEISEPRRLASRRTYIPKTVDDRGTGQGSVPAGPAVSALGGTGLMTRLLPEIAEVPEGVCE